MSTILYVKASPNNDGTSKTFEISDSFIKNYQEHNPMDKVVALDLYQENMGFLQKQHLAIREPNQGEDREHPILKYAYQFMEADKYVFAEPLWNLGIPAIMKAYFDYICIPGLTFKYTDQGPIGLCHGKKAINITTRGGEYSLEPGSKFEMGDRYIKTILGFLGITDYTTLAADRLDIVGEDVEGIMEAAKNKAQTLAKKF